MEFLTNLTMQALDTYDKVIHIFNHKIKRWMVLLALLVPGVALFIYIFLLNSMAMAPTERGYELHILATKLNILLYILAVVTGIVLTRKKKDRDD